MSVRYLILVGPRARSVVGRLGQYCEKNGLFPQFETENMIVLTNVDVPLVRLGEDEGVAIGYLFTKTSPSNRVYKTDGKVSAEIRKTGGRLLAERYWGGYVAAVGSCQRPGFILRDPSGAMPCYYIETDDVGTTAFSSDIETLIDSTLLVPQVEWNALTRHLIAYDLRTPETCLKGVIELNPGYRLDICSPKMPIQYWSPLQFASHSVPRNQARLARDLQIICTDVVRAWTACFKHPLLGVSGGLDSSILATILASSRNQKSFFTMTTRAADGDERLYTRALANELGVKIEEWFYRLADVDITVSTSSHLPRPLLCAFGQSEYRQKLQFAKSREVDAFFMGVGGDNVFCNLSSASPFLDRLYAEGPSIGALKTANDICELVNCSMVEVGVAALRRALKGRGYLWHKNTDLLTPKAAAIPTSQHPWLIEGWRLPPGKIAHVAMLARIQGTTDGYPRRDSPPLILPLLSQPLVEFCLSVPTWQWIHGGKSRAPARGAFAADLPKEVVDRKSKGTPNSFAFEVVDRNRRIARSFLADGVLASHGIIDSEYVARILADDIPLKGFTHMRLSNLLEAEAWCRHFQERAWRPRPCTRSEAAPVATGVTQSGSV